MDPVAASKARAILPEILDRVEAGEEVTIMRHGKPVAVILSPANLAARRAGDVMARAATVRAALDHARRSPIPSTGLSIERAEELIRDVRAGRSVP